MMECCYIKEIVKGMATLLTGMRVTMHNMLSESHTIQWPREAAPLPPRFRGHIVVLPDEMTRYPKCIACGNCARTCPSSCITVNGRKPAGARKKVAETFMLDFTKCSLCGLCVESCPIGALDFSRNYALADYSQTGYRHMNLLEDLVSPF